MLIICVLFNFHSSEILYYFTSYEEKEHTLDNVLDSCVIVLLKLMYLKSLIHAKKTHMAMPLLLIFDLQAQ